MVCESCGKDTPDVRERKCGYYEDLWGEEVLEGVCDACEAEHNDAL
jgi:hypothetical protein